MEFDPYYKWLAIPPQDQPPNHYRLLGVPLFTTDSDVIENAADQRMSHLRSFQTGKHAQASQRLLNEVAHARACLLNPQRRAEYDATLPRATMPFTATAPLAAARPIPLASPLPPPVVPPTVAPPLQTPAPEEPRVAAPRSSAKRRKSASPVVEIGKHIAGSLAGLLLGYIFVCWFSAAWDQFGLFHKLPAVTKFDPPTVQPPFNEPIEPAVTPAIKPSIPNVKPVVTPPQQVPPKPKQPMVTPPVTPSVEPKVELTPAQVAEQKQQQVDKLKEERTAAVEKGDIRNSLRLTDELAKLADLELLTEKAKTIEALTAGERTPAEATQLATMLIDLATEAILNDRSEFAAQQATAALLLARKSGDQDVVRKATKLVLEVQDKQPSP